MLLLDEPLAGLDWRARAELAETLKQLKSECTILVVSHDLRELTPLVRACVLLHSRLCGLLPVLFQVLGHIAWYTGINKTDRTFPLKNAFPDEQLLHVMQVDHAWQLQPGGKLKTAAWPPTEAAEA